MQRRDILRLIAALGVGGVTTYGGARAAVFDPQARGRAQPFDYAWLKGRARQLAGQAYAAPREHHQEAIRKLDWDQYQAIRFRAERALWADDDRWFRLQYFHLGLFYHAPVQLHEVRDGQAQVIAYDKEMFDYGKSGLSGTGLPPDLGFAGFRVQFHADWKRDVAAFLGASYFRAVGAEMQYGLSARGLAIDCGMERPEEFPAFTAYWFERPAAGSDRLIVHALLDSPSVAGAYRFEIHPASVLTMDVDAALYPRRAIERLGIAPLTSMFLNGENDHRQTQDWRPEIHDSDGLALWRGNGEWIWRPLTNPRQLRFNAYADDSPRGFGLLQRDRAFDHYQDDGVFYERRPDLWVEPRSDWGRGSVQLVELATGDETADNIVAYWNPETPAQPGQEMLFSYRLWWGTRTPAITPLAVVVATRTGIGGVVGRRREYFAWRFVVDFAGGPLAMLSPRAPLEPVISVARGRVEIPSVRPLAAVEGYRVIFDLRPPDDDDASPINLRVYLRLDGQALSETWLYQWTPPDAGQRRT